MTTKQPLLQEGLLCFFVYLVALSTLVAERTASFTQLYLPVTADIAERIENAVQ
ncbi:hypothetical protein [Pelosinus baikalensis]|uniref:Uncharacterized protein n=1 Tax=Pelosinus baikalensis TaxID=2892015 RepID=A0ABS8HZ41_9FIRM|nr:hypothetical protein [Pelosinus baikalensis]MCC5467876.1 hypothetical protein [Pelosinus baikalensis]